MPVEVRMATPTKPGDRVSLTDTDASANGTLLRLVNDALASQPAAPRMKIGPYELGEKIAEGSTSAIYLVLDASQSQPRVLRKMKLHDPPRADIERFRRSLTIARDELEHPNILRPEVVAEHDGLPYAVMPYLDTLEGLLACDEWPPMRCARVMHQLAAAVAHAHERGVIHCDLKPGNILWKVDIDGEDGKPLIIDFDSSRRIDPRDGQAGSSGDGGGATRAYMAPELATGRKPTVRADIYSLGVIFYEMLTSRLPYEGNLAGVIGGLTSARPVTSPRQHRPNIHRHFEAVCLACLEKDPNERYRNAAELVDDLACLLGNQRPKRYEGRLRGAKEWARRHPWQGALACSAFSLMAATGWQLWDPRPRAIAEENAQAARRVATEMGAQFEQLARAATRAAHDPALLAQLAAPEPTNLDPALKRHIRDVATGKDFSGMFVMNTDGWIRAHYPGAPDYIFRRSFGWRDYYLGARALAHEAARDPGAYVARAFRSETSERLEFGFSVPILVDSAPRGVLLARISGTDAMATLRARTEHSRADSGFWQRCRGWANLVLGNADELAQISVVLGPRDRDRLDGERDRGLPAGWVYLDHERLDPRSEVWLASEYAEPLSRAFGTGAPRGAQFNSWLGTPVLFDAYRDPFQAGDWSAAAFPIRQSGYVVLVQSDRGAPSNDPLRQFAGRLFAVLAGTSLLTVTLSARLRKSDRSR
jgi:hypothetical protein